MREVGYFVFTLPLELRVRFSTPEGWRSLRRLVVGILKGQGYARGLSRFHWFGDRDKLRFHPHLNVLVDEGYLDPDKDEDKDKLAQIKREYAAGLGIPVLDDEVPVIDVHYSYKPTIPMIVDCVKYCTRATFHDISTPENERLAFEVLGFRNAQAWGGPARWAGAPVHFLTSEEEPASQVLALSNNACPDCGGRIVWSSPVVYVSWLDCHPVEEIGGGFWSIGKSALF